MAAKEEDESAIKATIQNDPDAWAGGVLAIGSGAAKILTVLEHVDFLMSVNDGHFKMIFDFWDSIGWWIALSGGITWFIIRLLKPHHPKRSITWGFVVAVALMAFVFGAIWTAFSKDLPRIVVGMSPGSCAAQLDTDQLAGFSDKFNIALVCFLTDPTTDPLNDTKIAVSNPFTIVPGGIQVVADASRILPHVTSQPPPPSAPVPPANGQTPQPQQMTVITTQITINYAAILIPKDVGRDQFRTLAELERLGGKVLDPKYYQY